MIFVRGQVQSTGCFPKELKSQISIPMCLKKQKSYKNSYQNTVIEMGIKWTFDSLPLQTQP
jgi:hypothetical protein